MPLSPHVRGDAAQALTEVSAAAGSRASLPVAVALARTSSPVARRRQLLQQRAAEVVSIHPRAVGLTAKIRLSIELGAARHIIEGEPNAEGVLDGAQTAVCGRSIPATPYLSFRLDMTCSW